MRPVNATVLRFRITAKPHEADDQRQDLIFHGPHPRIRGIGSARQEHDPDRSLTTAPARGPDRRSAAAAAPRDARGKTTTGPSSEVGPGRPAPPPRGPYPDRRARRAGGTRHQAGINPCSQPTARTSSAQVPRARECSSADRRPLARSGNQPRRRNGPQPASAIPNSAYAA